VNRSCIISVDIGTSAVKAILCEIGGRPIATERAAYATCYPAPGRVEQDPDEILAALVRAIGRLVAASGRPAGSIAAQFALAFGMDVLAYDAFPDLSFRPSQRFAFAPLDSLLHAAD
jgi:sugar (pentulose or hexulose) kinase